MEQPGSGQLGVTFLPQSDKFLLGDPVLQVFVLFLVLLDGHERHGSGSALGGIVMARPDLDVVWQGEEFAAGFVEVACTSSREVATRGAYVGVEDGVATEYIV
jgi:hypothetical protein